MAAMESQNDEYNWIEAVGLSDASNIKQYLASVNFAMATVTTIGRFSALVFLPYV